MGTSNEQRIELAADILAGAAVTGLTVASGPASPGIAIGAAMSTPVLSSLLARTIKHFTELVEGAAGPEGAEGLEKHLLESPRAARLVLTVAEATATTDYPPKIQALGVALRDGVLYEQGTRFDVEAHIITSMCRVERLHVLILASLAERGLKKSRQMFNGEFPELAIPMDGLLQELLMFGLVEDRMATSGEGLYELETYGLTALGREVIGRFRVAGEHEDAPPSQP